MKKICDKCFKEIKEKDDYFKLETFLSGESFKISFMHKACQDEMNNQNKMLMEKIGNLSSFIPGMLKGLEIEPPTRVVRI